MSISCKPKQERLETLGVMRNFINHMSQPRRSSFAMDRRKSVNEASNLWKAECFITFACGAFHVFLVLPQHKAWPTFDGNDWQFKQIMTF